MIKKTIDIAILLLATVIVIGPAIRMGQIRYQSGPPSHQRLTRSALATSHPRSVHFVSHYYFETQTSGPLVASHGTTARFT